MLRERMELRYSRRSLTLKVNREIPLLLFLAASVCAQSVIATAQYDNQRTGANLAETILTPRNVNPERFGKLFVIPVDGDVYAQPLYVPNLEIPGKGVHNVVFVATEHESVYAVDAAGQPAAPLWRVSFINPDAGVNPVREQDMSCRFIPAEVGITPTPVIDTASRTIFVLVRTAERGRDGTVRFFQRLHALDLATGAERPGSPVLIRASVSGTTLFGLFSKEVSFHALLENPRAALLLSGGSVYVAWGSACDVGPYYGWVLAYDARTLKQTGVFNTSPDSGESGIWQSDTGIAADRDGAVYAVTGNGKFDAARGGRDYGDSVLKLASRNGALGVADYFTPFDEERLNRADIDLGSSGPVLLPDQPGPHPHLLVAAGKAGLVYLIDRDRMGGFRAASNSHAIQTLQVGTGAFGAPAYWNGHLYYANRNDMLKDFRLENGKLVPAHQGGEQFAHPGAIPCVSANGAKDGIVWLVVSKGRNRHGYDSDAILHAYDAADVSRELYSAVLGPSVRFAMPTVADGRVYVGAKGAVYVYGLRDRVRPTL
jgi:hypothetical protein